MKNILFVTLILFGCCTPLCATNEKLILSSHYTPLPAHIPPKAPIHIIPLDAILAARAQHAARRAQFIAKMATLRATLERAMLLSASFDKKG